ncbi:MAG TPA: SGNH/GDSL hydrolase family protein [Polyangiaceae bacterium]|nr:SGNH/GDSL hydrolase family protein [Polyangiaceae bacterium]
MHQIKLGSSVPIALFLALTACSSEPNGGTTKPPGSGGQAGAPTSGGSTATSGGKSASGGSGGASGGATNGSGGVSPSGGSTSGSGGTTVGGSMTAGGSAGTAGVAAGGTQASGGANTSGGSSALGGTSSGGTGAIAGTSSSGGMAGSTGIAGASGTGGSAGGGSMHWVGTWACGPQTTETNNLPPSPGLSGNTLRQYVHVTIPGKQLRIRLSNEFGTSPVTFESVHVAASKGGGAIDTATDKTLAFSGMPNVTVPAGKTVLSDMFDYNLPALSDLAISIKFGTQSGDVTGHPGSRTTSYLQSGNAVSEASLASAAKTDHWYFITGVDVMAPESAAAIVVLGDSISDGRGSTTNGNDRWPDALAKRLQANAATANVAVLNQGIGGNTVLAGGLGPTAKARFDRDVLGQTGAKWLIIFEGVNDIGNNSTGNVANDLIAAFGQFIEKAHAKNMKVFGAPITPFAGSQYDSSAHETTRQTVNQWIRTSGKFDAVIDLDAAVRDPNKQTALLGSYESADKDHLHLGPAGYKAMADAVDLTLFK